MPVIRQEPAPEPRSTPYGGGDGTQSRSAEVQRRPTAASLRARAAAAKEREAAAKEREAAARAARVASKIEEATTKILEKAVGAADVGVLSFVINVRPFLGDCFALAGAQNKLCANLRELGYKVTAYNNSDYEGFYSLSWRE